jgi:hypothetical protein
LALFSMLSVWAQSPEFDFEAYRLTRIATAVRITDEITLDGRLDEEAWKLGVPLTDFITRLPREGFPASEKTEVRLLYDDNNLYAGFTAFDSAIENLVINELREDFTFGQNDLCSIIIDSLHDGRSGFFFNVNPAGARRDGQIYNDGQTNADWDGVWDAKTSIAAEAYFVEIVIPFKTLRFTADEMQEWGLNTGRRISRRNEESQWSPVPQRFGGLKVSMAGTLRGLESIRQGRNLKVKPFFTAGVTQVRSNAPGGELQTLRSLTRFKDYDGGIDAKYSLTPSLTLDTTYRTDFAQVEVDQQQVNLTRFNVFFPEKRDFFLENAGTFTFGGGNNSNLVPFFSRRIGLSSAGTPIPIVGGARVTGQIDKYDVGFLAMKTESLGATPSNNYVVGRLKRNLFTRSWIGGLVTSRDSSNDGDYNRVFGIDASFVFYNKLELDSYILRSDTPQLTGRDQARRFSTAWRDDELVMSAEYNAVQANFNPEVGFIRREDMSQYSAELSWLPRLRQSRTIRNLIFTTTVDYFEDDAGTVETRTQVLNLGAQLTNGGSVNFEAERTFDRLVEDFAIRPSVVIPLGDYPYTSYTGRFTSNQSRMFAGSGSITTGGFWHGDRKSVTGGLTIRPDYHLNIGLDYSRNRVSLPGSGAFTTELIGARFLYAFTARAFLNAFFQYNADTHQVSSNIRFNLIHHPLSDLYLVYNDRRDTRAGLLLERAFIVKVTNLFTF